VPTAASCPDRQQLQAFLLGQLAEPDARSVTGHLPQCAPCRTLLGQLAANGLDATRSGPPASFAGLARPHGSPSDFPFLLPPIDADELGRLQNFRVLKLLGTGGMALVFQAEDIALRRPVALKVMKPGLNDAEVRQRFLREARALALLKHEHLVTIYQAGQEGDTVFLAEELLAGETLESWLKRFPQPAVHSILQLGREIATGLAAIHRHGLVHRDVKPANIWLESLPAAGATVGFHVKILDLGLVRPVVEDTHLTQIGMVVGTPAFMSPEQARGDALDARSDLFSLGCILYSLCTGRRPFRADNTLALVSALALDHPQPIEQLNPLIPLALARLVMELLAKAPGDRPPTAEAVVARLRQLETAPSAASGPVDVTTHLDQLAARRGLPRPSRRLILTALLAGLATVFCLGWLFSLFAPAERTAEGVRVYLSDLPRQDPVNWPLQRPRDEKDEKWNKGPPPPDFGAVQVNGTVSPHGLWMHPPPGWQGAASLSFDLGGQYRQFQAEVALNDSFPRSPTPFVFRVLGDGRELWKSEPVLGREHTQRCAVAVQGVQRLRLEVTAAGDHVRGAHAVWVEPVLTK